jgi:hypothetical protein
MSENNQNQEKVETEPTNPEFPPTSENIALEPIPAIGQANTHISTNNLLNTLETPINWLNNTLLEHTRALILQALEDKQMSFDKIGRKCGMAGSYVTMILNYKTWPKKAENQIKLMRKFEKLKPLIETKGIFCPHCHQELSVIIK